MLTVLVDDGGGGRRSAGRQAIEAARQDRRDVAVGAGAGGQRPATRRLEPRGVVALGEPEDPRQER